MLGKASDEVPAYENHKAASRTNRQTRQRDERVHNAPSEAAPVSALDKVSFAGIPEDELTAARA